jgi:hypothetical protein
MQALMELKKGLHEERADDKKPDEVAMYVIVVIMGIGKPTRRRTKEDERNAVGQQCHTVIYIE